MSELEFSVIFSEAGEMPSLETMIEKFTAESRMPVRLRKLSWDDARDELNKVAIYNAGPDISQVGSTWLRDFADMNALRTFTPAEVRTCGASSEFVPALWESSTLHGRPGMWAMPWLVDTRVLFYRRDLLAQAGVDEAYAFDTTEAMAQTFEKLQACGVRIPWVVPSRLSWRTLHGVASWIWGAGGDLISADGKRPLFDKPEARSGIKAYFSLARYLSEEARGLTDIETDALFRAGKAAVTLSGTWLLDIDEKQLVDVGVASPPGIPFVGGSHLVIWKHTAKVREAIQLVRFLTGLEFQTSLGRRGLLPARLEALTLLNTSSREFSEQLRRVLVKGRSFPSVHLWGLIEERLNNALGDVWADVLQLPEVTPQELDAVLDTHLGPLARRLLMLLTSS